MQEPGAPSNSGEAWKCGLCRRPFQTPKQLPCAHTFCLACLQQRPEAGPICPTCNKPFDVPLGGLDQLPANVFAECLLEYQAACNLANVNNAGNNEMDDSAADEGRAVIEVGMPNKCDICQKDNPTKSGSMEVASVFCRDCNQNFCATCLHLHSIMPVTESHKLIEVLKKDDVDTLRRSFDRRCDMHGEEQERFYCFKCDIPICEKCRTNNHQDHNVSDVREASSSLRMQLLKTSLQVRERLYVVDDELNKQTEQTDLLLDEIRQMRIVVYRLVSEREWQTLENHCQPDELETAMAYRKSIEKEQHMKTKKELLETLLIKLDNLRKHASPCEIMCTAKEYLKNSELTVNWTDQPLGSTTEAVGFEDYLLIMGATQRSPSMWNAHLASFRKPFTFKSIPFAPKWAGPHTGVVMHSDTIYGIGLGQENNELWTWTCIPGCWSRKANMPFGRTGAAVIKINDVIYVLGGSSLTNGHASDLVQSYNTKTNSWSVNGRLKQAVYDPTGIEENGVIYLFGGSTLKATLLPIIQTYDTRTDVSHLESATIPYKQKLSPIKCGSNVIFIGNAACWLWDLNTMIWSSRNGYRANMKQFSVGLVDDGKGARLYVAGGRTDGSDAWQYFDVKYVMIDKLLGDILPATWVSNISFKPTEFESDIIYTSTTTGTMRFCANLQ